MITLRVALLATTALTLGQIAAMPSHAQTSPQQMAQAPAGETGPDGKPVVKQPPKGPPPGAPQRPAGPGGGAAPPQAPPPAAAPPRAEPPARTAPPPAATAPAAPPPAAAPRPTPPAAAPPEAPRRPTPPPAAAPQRPTAPPAATAPQRPAAPTQPAQPSAPTAAPPAAVTPPPGAAPAQRSAPGAGPAERQGLERRAPGATAPGAPAPGAAAPGAPAAAPTPSTAPSPAPTPAPGPGGGAASPPAAAPAPAAGGTPPNSPGASQRGAASPGGAAAAPPPPPTVTAPIPPAPPPPQALAPIAPGAAAPGPRNLADFRNQRREVQEGGRTVITEPGRVIIRDPGGQAFIRHNEVDRFRYGARDIRVQQVGDESRTIVVRPDGSEIITVNGRDGQLLRRIRRDREGREIIIIDNSYREPRDRGSFYVDLPPPVLRIPRNRYIVDYEDASPELIYETLEAPPVERIERRYSLDEIRYSAGVRQRMPSIDLDTITFELGSWEIPPDQAAKLQAIADGLNKSIARNPREVFLIEGHTDAVGNDTDNLSLSDRRAEAAAQLLTQQFGVPAENLTSQGYGEQYLKVPTQAPERQNRRVTVRRITPLLNGGTASLPPPPPGVAPPR
ncbi:OmpA family protein [Rhodopseudomonas palustris]|uniref:OmpA/MotB n=1 Tax=Rhodopseudomonas palustris (strain BisB18) TaxID=316056 RepID=Q21D92_RHOPB